MPRMNPNRPHAGIRPAVPAEDPRIRQEEQDKRLAYTHRLISCVHCEELGDKTAMIYGQRGHDPTRPHHPHCYLAHYGFTCATFLPSPDRGKFRLCDFSATQLREMAKVPR